MNFRFGHICLFVTDLEKSLDFYCNKLGFKVMFEEEYPAYNLHNVYLRINSGQFIELFGNLDQRDNAKASIQHFCLHVDNMERVHAQLSEMCLPVSPIRMGKAKCIMCNLSDPDGNQIELMELLPDSLHSIHDHD